jgi:voltage-gated potassium channel
MKHINDFLLGNYQQPPPDTLRGEVYDIVFESHTRKGKAFDVALLIAILVSVLVVMIDSVPSIHAEYKEEFYILEWVFTIIFSIEYLLRLWCVDNRKGYAFSLYGLIDLISVLPTYFSLLIGGAQYLLVIRAIRLLRIFRVLKMPLYLSEGSSLVQALLRSYRKINVFLLFVLTLVTVLGSLMYLIEGHTHGFTSIPESIYWAIVTLTTVGYGDISPETPLGKIVACIIMLSGYAIIAVPTGIVTSEMTKIKGEEHDKRICETCHKSTLDRSASYCANCGAELPTNPS